MNLAKAFHLRRVPWQYRQILRRTVLWPRDWGDTLLGRRPALVPPRRLQFVGDGDYLQRGLEAYQLFARLWQLQATDKILDIGCGIGRMSVPLITELKLRGEYHGFDIVPAGIRWAQRHISSHHPNYHFQWAAVFNERYNPGGTMKPGEFVFPFAGATFDFAFATSVFTHMWRADVCHYLQEARRVLKPGAGAVFTFFLVNERVRERMAAKQAAIPLSLERERTFYADADDPLLAVGFEEADLRQLLAECKLGVCRPVEYGTWSGGQALPGAQFQDVVTVEAV